MDCDVESEISSRFHISKYPTLKLVMNGKHLKKEFRGQRSVEAISTYVRDLLKDPVTHVITSADFEKIEEKKPAIVGYFTASPNSVPGSRAAFPSTP